MINLRSNRGHLRCKSSVLTPTTPREIPAPCQVLVASLQGAGDTVQIFLTLEVLCMAPKEIWLVSPGLALLGVLVSMLGSQYSCSPGSC